MRMVCSSSSRGPWNSARPAKIRGYRWQKPGSFTRTWLAARLLTEASRPHVHHHSPDQSRIDLQLVQGLNFADIEVGGLALDAHYPSFIDSHTNSSLVNLETSVTPPQPWPHKNDSQLLQDFHFEGTEVGGFALGTLAPPKHSLLSS